MKVKRIRTTLLEGIHALVIDEKPLGQAMISAFHTWQGSGMFPSENIEKALAVLAAIFDMSFRIDLPHSDKNGVRIARVRSLFEAGKIDEVTLHLCGGDFLPESHKRSIPRCRTLQSGHRPVRLNIKYTSNAQLVAAAMSQGLPD